MITSFNQTTSLQARRTALDQVWETKTRRMLANGMMIAVVPPMIALSIAASVPPVLGGLPTAAAFIITVGCIMAAAFLITKGATERRLPLYILTGSRTHDPHAAARMILTLIDEIKSPTSTARRRQQRFDAARQAMQDTAGVNPLSLLVRKGYYPSRPERTTEGGQKVITNHDQDGMHAHWDRTVKAVSDLQILLATDPDVPLTWRQVLQALAEVVPPLRAVCRNAGIDTHLIEYMPDTFTPRADTVQPQIGEDRTKALPRSDQEDVEDDEIEQIADVLTPIEARMNASAALITASIRTLILSFSAAEADVFVGDDQNTGRQLIDRQLPALVRAYVISHDGSSGQERDDVRADFARSLTVVRDALEQIMNRYVRNAREIMLNETRFLEMRHGDTDPLGARADEVNAPRAP